MTRSWSLTILLLLLAACQRPDSAFVSDPGALLDASSRSRIAASHRALLRDGDIHFRLEILAEASPDINRAAVERFDKFRLGETTRGARGVLLLIDPHGKQVRLEIGYDLEGVFPDGFVGYVEEQQLAPFFRAGLVSSGIEATVELLVARALDEHAFDPAALPAPPAHLSGGAGARIDVAIGVSSPGESKPPSQLSYPAGSSVEESMRCYMQVLSAGVRDSDLGLYTPETRALLQEWTVTPAQQQHELRRLEQAFGSHQVISSAERAVLRFAPGERQLPPYFFRLSPSGWQLDFTLMADSIGFNHKNQWHFRQLPEPYAFAFSDWRLDRHGFPHQKGGRVE